MRRSRRRLLGCGVAAFGGVAAGAALVPVLRFVFSPVTQRPPAEWQGIGAISEFPLGRTVKVEFFDPSPELWAGVTQMSAAYVRRVEEERFIAISANCTHTGCPVRWERGAQVFLCPCHGGVFDRDGDVLGGPPARALERHPLRVREGQLEIGTQRLPVEASGALVRLRRRP